MKLKTVLATVILGLSISANSQDTLKINLQQADSIFQRNNFSLLASSMNIEAQKAQIIQAKVYPNPIFTVDLNVYDPENNKAFHVGPSGQKGFQLEQLILLGGKRKSEIEMAKTNSQIAELEFQQLLLQLKFRLHSDLFSMGQIQALLQRYSQQLELLESLVAAYEIQAQKGNIPLKDVVRLKGAYLNLNNNRADLLKDYFQTQSSIQTLLQTNAVVKFEFNESDIEKYIQQNAVEELKNEAFRSNPELQIIQSNKILAKQYLQYQKRLAVPDINIITSYDQRGGAFNNQFNAGFAIPLPLWNRNRGNIKASQYKIKEADYNVQSMQNEITSNIQNAFQLYLQSVIEYQKSTALYNADFEVTVNGMTENFQKRNVSLIEFMDFFEAYNETLNELTRIKTQLVISAERINLLTGKAIY